MIMGVLKNIEGVIARSEVEQVSPKPAKIGRSQGAPALQRCHT